MIIRFIFNHQKTIVLKFFSIWSKYYKYFDRKNKSLFMFGYTWSDLNELLCTIVLQQIIIILVLISSSFNINNFFDINWKLIYFKVQVYLTMMKTQTVVLDSVKKIIFRFILSTDDEFIQLVLLIYCLFICLSIMISWRCA